MAALSHHDLHDDPRREPSAPCVASGSRQPRPLAHMDRIDRIVGTDPHEPGTVGCLCPQSPEMDGIEQGSSVERAKRVSPKDPQAFAD